MNTFQRISQELIIEDLKVKGDTNSAAFSDPVARQFIWRRHHAEQADANGSSQDAAYRRAEGKNTNSFKRD